MNLLVQGKTNWKYILIVVTLSVIVGGAISWYYWSLLKEREPLIEKELAELENRQYRREIVFNLENDEVLKNFQISLHLDTLSLIRERKLSLDCGNIRFTDSDEETEIPYWIKGDCGEKDTEIWLRVPEILPDSEKSIYVYYGNESKPSASNFDEVFKTNDDLLGWYYFDELKRRAVTDLSMNKNDGNIAEFSPYDWPSKMKLLCENKHRCFIFLDNWGEREEWTDIPDAYFELPARGLDFDKSQGSIEIWVKPDNAESGKYQRLVIDTNWQIELGINPRGDLYFYPAQAPKDNYNIISRPLKNNEWNHLIVTWNFETKEVTFYINGEKRKNDIENVPEYWEEIAQTGNWQVGGTNLDIESAFVGILDGLRIYGRALDDEEVKAAYRYNGRTARYPTISWGKEELILVKRMLGETFDPLLIKNIDLTDKIYLDTCYATPLKGMYRWAGYPTREKYIDQATGEHLFLISKHLDEYIPILGVPSHFFPYEGAGTEIKNSFLVSYIGLEINNLRLVKDLRIEFKKIESYEYGVNSFWGRLISKAYACGPFYSYKIVGESEFSLIEEKEGIYWYELKIPIFIDEETTMMQLYYKPNGVEGKFSIRIADMVFTDKNQKLFRPTFVENGIVPYGRYLAHLANEEKGFILFRENPDTQALEISFENRGKDSINIDDQSIWNIETQTVRWRVNNINIQNLNGDIIKEISMVEVKNQISRKEIAPGQAIGVPLVSLQNLQKNTSYYITIGTGEETRLKEITDQKRIIRWIFGDNSYYYPRHRVNDELYLYRLNIAEDGSVSLEEIR